MLIKGFEPLCIKQLILSQPCIPVPPYERIAVSEESNLTVSLLNNPKTKSGLVSLPCLRLQHTIHISVLMIHECVLLYFHISFPPLQQMTNTRLELSIFALRGRCPKPLDDRAVCQCACENGWGGRSRTLTDGTRIRCTDHYTTPQYTHTLLRPSQALRVSHLKRE